MTAAPTGHRVILVGPGGIGAVFARLAAGAGDTLTGVVASTPASGHRHAKALSDAYGMDVSAFETLEAALMGGGAEGIIISAPEEAHAALLKAALPTGLPILCEKPLIWHEDQAALHTDLAWLAQYREAPFVFNASNHTLLEGLKEGLAGQKPDATFHFLFHTNGRHRGPEILKDLLPHAISLLQKLFGTADVHDGHMVVEPNRCDGNFFYGDQRVHIDFEQGPKAVKALRFGFDDHIYSREQEGRAETYRVFLRGPHANDGSALPGTTRRHECADPFDVSYTRFRHLMASAGMSGEMQAPDDGHDLSWAIENCRLCDQLIRMGPREE